MRRAVGAARGDVGTGGRAVTVRVREATKKVEPVRVVICAGPGRWLCTVGYGHLCGDAEVAT